MPHWLKTITLSVLLGATTTVAAAWALSAFPTRPSRHMLFADAPNSGNGLYCSTSRSDTIGCTAITAALTTMHLDFPFGQRAELEWVVPRWARHELLDWTSSSSPVLPVGVNRGVIAAGWPTPAMWCSFDQQPGSGVWWFKARNGIVIASASSWPVYTALSPHERVLPLRVAPVGFAVCIAFWGAIWWGLLFAPRWIRRRLRQRAGRCVKCGYDRKGLAPDVPCPECGETTNPCVP